MCSQVSTILSEFRATTAPSTTSWAEPLLSSKLVTRPHSSRFSGCGKSNKALRDWVIPSGITVKIIPLTGTALERSATFSNKYGETIDGGTMMMNRHIKSAKLSRTFRMRKPPSGFSLIELTVAVALFMVVGRGSRGPESKHEAVYTRVVKQAVLYWDKMVTPIGEACMA